jgi:hypothetical protein
MNPRIPSSSRLPPLAGPSSAPTEATSAPGAARHGGAAGEPPGLPPSPRHPLGARAQAPRFVAPEHKQLAVYLAARAVDGRPVQGDALHRLQRADAVVQGTRKTLLHGRGNVKADIDATRHESSRRCSVSYSFCEERLPAMVPGGVSVMDEAAVAAATGAGVCDDFANLAVSRYAAQQTDRETLLLMGSERAQHLWAEVRPCPASPAEGSEPAATAGSITMDGWAQGPAVYAEDRNAQVYGADAQSIQAFDHREAPALRDRYERTFARVADPIQRVMHTELRAMERQGATRRTGVFPAATHVFSTEFAARVQAKRAHGPGGPMATQARAARFVAEAARQEPDADIRTAIDAHGNSLRDILAAVSAGRALGANPAGAVQDTPALLDSVQKLPDIENHPQPVRSRR